MLLIYKDQLDYDDISFNSKTVNYHLKEVNSLLYKPTELDENLEESFRLYREQIEYVNSYNQTMDSLKLVYWLDNSHHKICKPGFDSLKPMTRFYFDCLLMSYSFYKANYKELSIFGFKEIWLLILDNNEFAALRQDLTKGLINCNDVSLIILNEQLNEIALTEIENIEKVFIYSDIVFFQRNKNMFLISQQKNARPTKINDGQLNLLKDLNLYWINRLGVKYYYSTSSANIFINYYDNFEKLIEIYYQKGVSDLLCPIIKIQEVDNFKLVEHEYCGPTLREVIIEKKLSLIEKKKLVEEIINIYTKLNSFGLAHNKVNLGNLCLHNDNSIKIIVLEYITHSNVFNDIEKISLDILCIFIFRQGYISCQIKNYLANFTLIDVMEQICIDSVKKIHVAYSKFVRWGRVNDIDDLIDELHKLYLKGC